MTLLPGLSRADGGSVGPGAGQSAFAQRPAGKALFDSLTGLRNRHHLDEALHSQMALAVHTHTPLSCLMIDIDHFKTINDRYGHEAGDLVIKSVATIVQRAVRDIGMAFRYGARSFSAAPRD